jgi:hypothetical protein
MSACNINDAEPAHSKPGIPAYENSFIIGPAMYDRIAHAADSGFFDSVAAICADDPCNSAHD